MAIGQQGMFGKATVYAAIELSKKSWVVGIAHPDRDRPSIHRFVGGNLPGVVARLRKAAGDERRILVCYEAGYDGFWVARSLTRLGIDCRVLDPASIQVNRRARRVKTDRIDTLALLRALIAIDRGERHVCSVVRVPTIEEEDARRSHRERQRLIRERTGHINRIKGLLFGQGIRGVEPKLQRTRIDFGALITAEGKPLPERLRRELERECQRLDLVQRQLRAVEEERDNADAQDPAVERKRELLCALHGVGNASAAILAREVFARSFASRRQLGSYLGLTPSAYDSGSTTRCQGISKAGNSWARRVLIEVAWLWRKYQPDSPLSRWYAQRTSGQSPRIRRIMLVAMARKLAISLWRYVETGLVPAGTVMSKTTPHGSAAA
jgi:transposase